MIARHAIVIAYGGPSAHPQAGGIGFGILGYLAIRIYREAGGRAAIQADLAIEYIVATSILVLNWWVESRSRLSAREVNDVFLALVVPALTSAVGRSGER